MPVASLSSLLAWLDGEYNREMEGVTTAIVAFIFACLIWPHLVKVRAQFYSAIGLVMLIILFDAIGHMAGDGVLPHVMYVLAAVIQMLTILILVMCVGGLSPRELAGEISETVQTIRQGGEQKPVLVPLKGEQPMPREEKPVERQTINLDDDDDGIELR
jgi:hypothetical protein